MQSVPRFSQLWLPRQICMGVCLHQDVTEEGKKAKLQSSKIEQDLCEHAKTEMNVVKILMLGKWNCRNVDTIVSVSEVTFCMCARGWREWKEHPHQTDQDNPQPGFLQTGAPQFQGIGKSIFCSHLEHNELNDVTAACRLLPFAACGAGQPADLHEVCASRDGDAEGQPRKQEQQGDEETAPVPVGSWIFNIFIAAPF